MGLGLSISRAIAEMHQGSLEVRNNEGGVGCTFSVRLALPLAPPLSAGAPQEHGTSSTALASSTTELDLLRGYDCHVLAADDVLMNRVAVQEMLRALGCTVDVVVDGVAAVDAVRARQPQPQPQPQSPIPNPQSPIPNPHSHPPPLPLPQT